MNNEIKEIINDLQRVADRKCYPEDILDGSIAQEWVDYITNLQEENKQLKKKINIEWLSDEGKYQYAIDSIVLEMDKLEERIDKAIEILQGSDKE